MLKYLEHELTQGVFAGRYEALLGPETMQCVKKLRLLQRQVATAPVTVQCSKALSPSDSCCYPLLHMPKFKPYTLATHASTEAQQAPR